MMKKKIDKKIKIPTETISETPKKDSTEADYLEEKLNLSTSSNIELIHFAQYLDNKISNSINPIREKIASISNEFASIRGQFGILLWIVGIGVSIFLGLFSFFTNLSLKKLTSFEEDLKVISRDINSIKEDHKLSLYRMEKLEGESKMNTEAEVKKNELIHN